MAEVDVILKDGNKKKLELKNSIFSLKVNPVVLSEAVRAYLLNQRSGNASTKTRAEVRGGGRKPWRQKGTGRARAGSIRSPLWRGGGVVFGPKPRNYRCELPKKKKRLALKYALSDFYKNKKFIVVEELNIDEYKTKKAVEFLKKIGVDAGEEKILIIDEPLKKEIRLSFRNIPKLEILPVNNLNVYILLWADVLVLTENALKRIEEIWG